MTDPALIQLIVFDVDGVLTDGVVHYTEAGDEAKHFHIRDGLGIVAALRVGLAVGVITSRTSRLLERRMGELGVEALVQGCRDKAAAVTQMAEHFGVALNDTAFVGDDLVDLPALAIVGYPIAVADAADEVRDAAAFVTQRPGGAGAGREAIEHLLKASGRWDQVVAGYRDPSKK